VLFDRLIRFIDEKPGQPFYALCWTDQTHDPYQLGLASQEMDFFGQQIPARHSNDLGRYLNVLRQVDQNLASLFRALRNRGLADDTLLVITGDHGEALAIPTVSAAWLHGISEAECAADSLESAAFSRRSATRHDRRARGSERHRR
jgi:arylsulfatase A-like enzyme